MPRTFNRPELRKKMAAGKRPPKYHAHRVMLDGIMFDSKKEAARYSELRLLERSGKIRNLEVKPKFEFMMPNGELLRYPPTPKIKTGRRVTHRPDFRYTVLDEGAPHVVVEDTKGFDTDMGRLKRGLVQAFHGIHIRIT